MKNLTIIILLCVGLLVGAVWWSKSLQNKDPNIVSTNGLHWHPEIEIYVKGQKIEIPKDLGIGVQYSNIKGYDPSMKMTPVHTHDEEGIIHFEFQNVVRKEDLTLSQFFKIWGKDFDFFGSSVTMTVNGQPSLEFGDYEMKDKDKIVLRYE